jgi:hypothetical protein
MSYSTHPTMDSVISSVFGIPVHSLADLLRNLHGYIAGGACSSTFLGKNLCDSQDLDIWIPLPLTSKHVSSIGTDGTRWSPSYYIQIVSDLIHNFMTTIQKRPTQKKMLTMSLDSIINNYKGCYQKSASSYAYDRSVRSIYRIDRFENPYTGRQVQFIYTYDISIRDIIDNFDMDVCQFFAQPMGNTFPIQHFHDSKTISRITKGFGQYLIDMTTLSDKERLKCKNRIQKYTARGFIFHVLSSAPEKDIVKDIHILSDKYYNTSDSKQYLYNLLEESGCHFDGSDTDGNIELIRKYMKEKQCEYHTNMDIWKVTFRFTWDAVKRDENIYVIKTELMNPF